MSTLNFVITKRNIYNRIFATSAYTTRAREATGMPQSISESMLLTTDEKRIIDPLIENSINEIFSFIACYHPATSIDYSTDDNDGAYIFNIKAPANYPAGNEGKLAKSIESYVTNRTLQDWYTCMKPDEASLVAAKTQNDITTLQSLLTQRGKPQIMEE